MCIRDRSSYDPDQVADLLSHIDRTTIDELEPYEPNIPDEKELTISLIFPHWKAGTLPLTCLLYTSPSPRDRTRSRMPSSA